MALLDAKFVALGLSLLTKYGMSAKVIIRNEGSSFDPYTNMREDAGDYELQVFAVPPSIVKNLIRDGSDETTMSTYLSPVQLVDDNKDTVELINCDSFITSDGEKFKIVERVKIYSGDEVALIRLDLE